MGNHIPLGDIALALGAGRVIGLVVTVLGQVEGDGFWWGVVPCWGGKVMGEVRGGGVWELFVESLLVVLVADRSSTLTRSMVLICLIMDVKLGDLFCPLVIF